MEGSYFGWELLSATIEDTIRCPSDLIVVFVHWQMIRSAFSCLGTGSEKSASKDDCGSESLPQDWNCEQNHYSLRYMFGNDLYILTCIVLEETTCLFNLYNSCKGTVSNLSLELREIMNMCANRGKKITDIFPKADMLMCRIHQELLVPVAGCCGCTNEPQDRPQDPEVPQRPPNEDRKCIRPNYSTYGPPVGGAQCCNMQEQLRGGSPRPSELLNYSDDVSRNYSATGGYNRINCPPIEEAAPPTTGQSTKTGPENNNIDECVENIWSILNQISEELPGITNKPGHG